MGIAAKMSAKARLVNTRHNISTTIATNTPNKRNIKIGRSTYVLQLLTALQKDLKIFVRSNLGFFSKNWYK